MEHTDMTGLYIVLFIILFKSCGISNDTDYIREKTQVSCEADLLPMPPIPED